MKTIDDLLKHGELVEQESNSWFDKFRTMPVSSMSDEERHIKMYMDRKGRDAFDKTMKEFMYADRHGYIDSSRRFGKSDAIKTAGLDMKAREREIEMRKAQYQYNLTMHKLNCELEKEKIKNQ